MELASGAKNSESGVMKQERGRREDYALVGVRNFSNNHSLFLKVCNSLIVENATSVEE